MKELNVLIFSLLLVGEVSAQVGLGTTTPSNDLDVESSSATATAIDINCTGAGDPKINFQLNGTSTFSMGIDNSDADKFKIGTSALETSTRLTIDASGNVGIGTGTPNALLQLGNSVNNRKIVLYDDWNDGNQFFGFGINNLILRYQVPWPSTNHVFYAGTSSTTSNELMRITGTGNVGIGTSSPTARLDVDGGVIFNKSKQRVDFTVMSELSDYMLYVNNTWNRVGINQSNPQYTFAVNGTVGANGYTAFTNYSDSRLKTNIANLDTGVLSKIMQLRPVSFQYNQKYLQLYAGSDLQKVHKGFIAQEIRNVFPEMVSEMAASPDSVQYLDLDVSHLQVYLVKALQEQQAIINAQKSEIDSQKAEAMLQKAEIDNQKSEIDALKVNALKVAALENKMNAMLLLLNNKQELTVKQ